jgi:choline dehydrogenase-like flavoprotein
VTLRNSDDGWGRDIYGVYREEGWHFWLDRAKYPASFDASLVLDRTMFMIEDNVQLTPDKLEYNLNDDDVHFPSKPSAYVHGYDNFLSIESPLEQFTVRAKGSESEDYDVIIIGSGMGGGVLADALSDRGARTLVLDAGGLWFPVHMCELPRSEINLPERDELGHYSREHGTELTRGVHFNMGGRSIYWSGLIPRMSNWEMQDRWPEAVRRYLTEPDEDGLSGYDRAEKLMRKGKTLGPFQVRVRDHLEKALGSEFNVIDLPRSLHQPYLDDQGNLQNVLEKPTGVFSTTDLLLDSLGFNGRAGRDNLRINLHHLATQIVKSDQKATAVVCQDLTHTVKRERTYHGKYIVLACGSLESAKLALNSDLNDPADDNEKMGFGLTDHPTYFYQTHHDLPNEGPLAWVGDSRGHAKILIQHKAASPTAHAYNIELLINPKYWDTRHADDDQWKALVDKQKMSKVELQFKFDSNLDLNNYIQPVGAIGEGKKPKVRVAPNPPTSAFNDEIVEYRNKILTALGVTDFSDHWDPGEWKDGKEGSVHHAGGTLRMSANGSDVVDEHLKFQKYDNLYCCDLSVFPTIPAANPSLTLVALALRLADTLSARLGLSPVKGSSLLV